MGRFSRCQEAGQCPVPYRMRQAEGLAHAARRPRPTRPGPPRLGLAAGTGRRCFTAKPSQGLSELPAGLPVVRRCRRSPRTSLKAGKGPLFSPHLPCRGRRQEKPLRQVAGETRGPHAARQFPAEPRQPRPLPAPRLGLPRESSWQSGCRTALWKRVVGQVSLAGSGDLTGLGLSWRFL